MPNTKLTTLAHLQMLATRVKSEDDALGAKIAAVATDVENLAAAGGEANLLEGVKVNGQALAITDKMVDILIASGEENGTLSVNGAAVAITGLQALAYKANVSEADLDEALKVSIAAKATQADLDALTVRVATAEGAIEEIKGTDYQTAAQVEAIAQAAVAASGHAHFEEADAIPTPDQAQENVMYLVMNAETGHYDIYAKVSGAVKLLDDVSVDLTNYSTTEQMQTAIAAAIEALNIGDYAKAADLLAIIERVTAVENKFSDYYTKSEINATLEGYATEEEASAIADERIAASQATDEEVNAILDETFTPAT